MKRLFTLTLMGMTLLSTTTVCAKTMFDGETEKRRAQGYYANGFLFTNDGNYWDYDNSNGKLAFNEEVFVDFDTKGTPEKEDDELLYDTVYSWGKIRKANGNQYPATLKVVSLDTETDTVTCKNSNGFYYTFKGVEDWMVGDGVSATMNDNGTEYVMDDYIESVRYTSWELNNQFKDVSETDWYYNSVLWATENGITSGTTGTTFSPNETVTRAQAVTFLYRLFGSPEVTYEQKYSDVSENDWYAKAVIWASKAHITSGYTDGSFGANDEVTREQLVTFMYRYAKYLDLETEKTEISQFIDYDKVNDYAFEPMEWAYGYSLIKGKSPSRLEPQGKATRAECVAVIERFCDAYNLM